MKCSQCGKEMEFIGSVAMQDDYTKVEDLCFNIVERFKCNDCDVTNEFMKSVNGGDDKKTPSNLKFLNKK